MAKSVTRGCYSKKAKGFTYLQLIFTLLILAILASIAYPSYRDQLQRVRRNEAKAILVEMAQFMERHYSHNNSYSAAVLPVTQSPAAGAPIYSVTFATACILGKQPTASNPESQCFLIQAVPAAGKPMEEDACGTLTIDHTGSKTATGRGGSLDCWAK